MNLHVAHPYIVAEPGCTAEGSYTAMLELIDIAAMAGCDAIKLQWTSDPVWMTQRRRAFKCANATRGLAYADVYQWLNFPLEWHPRLAAYAHARDLEYGCSIYTPGDAAKLANVVDFLKISAFEAQADDVAREAIQTGRPVIVSLGMGAKVHDVLGRAARSDVSTAYFLQCTSAYPAPLDSLNLGRIRREQLDGFSDHSAPSETTIGGLAVAAGARILETHMRSHHCEPENPDYGVARDPDQLVAYVAFARLAATCVTEYQTDAEAAMRAFQVRSC